MRRLDRMQPPVDRALSGGVTRRNVLAGAAGIAAASVMGSSAGVRAAEPGKIDLDPVVQRGRINQSVSRGCYDGISAQRLTAAAATMGLKSVELIHPRHWPVLKKHGLICAMTRSHRLSKGLAHKENWDYCLGEIRKAIEATAEAGFPNVICFSGNRKGMSDEQGLENCVQAVKKIVGLAEKKKVTLCMELLNSKVNHPGYMCDHVDWGVKLCKRVGSPRFRLLYDIYHMQIMDGDIIRTIRNHHECFAHYHTAGVPGRHLIDETQELYYPAIMRAILDTGYEGYVGHEFTPVDHPLKSLARGAAICDV